MKLVRDIETVFWADYERVPNVDTIKYLVSSAGILPDRHGNTERSTTPQAFQDYILGNTGSHILALAEDDTGIMLPRRGWGYYVTPFKGSAAVYSYVPQHVVDAMGVVDLRTAGIPSAHKRELYPSMRHLHIEIYNSANLNEEFFAGVHGKLPAVVIRGFMRGEEPVETEASLQTVPQMLRGNRAFLALRRFQVAAYGGTWVPLDLVIPVFIAATKVSDWSARAHHYFRYAFAPAMIGQTGHLRAWLPPLAATTVIESLPITHGGQVCDVLTRQRNAPLAITLPSAQALPATRLDVLATYNKAVFSDSAAGALEIKSRVQSARAEYENVEGEIKALELNHQLLGATLAQLIEEMRSVQGRLQHIRPQLSETSQRIVEKQTSYKKAQIRYNGLQAASEKFYQKFLEEARGLNVSGSELVEYFARWGVQLTKLTFFNSEGETLDVRDISLDDLMTGTLRVNCVRFQTTTPRKMDCITGHNGQITDHRMAGPFDVEVTRSSDDGITFSYRLASDNGVVGVGWRENHGYSKIHPHHAASRWEETITGIQEWITNPCLGELAPNLQRAMKHGNIQEIVVGCLTFLWTANAYNDYWGQHYTWFPKPENYQFDWAPSTRKAFKDNIGNAYGIQRKFFNEYTVRLIQNDALGVCLFQLVRDDEFNVNTISRWIPIGGRTIYELAESVLSEQPDWADELLGDQGWETIMGKIPVIKTEIDTAAVAEALAAEEL